MENTNIQLAANIQKFRKKSGLTQDELAKELGVTFQAISKWENAKSAPDILLLPQMADIFGCHIDELFSREVNTTVNYNLCAELPWHDDEVIRVFQTQGKKILKVEDEQGGSGVNFCVEFPKNCNETTRQYFQVEVLGNVITDSSINGNVTAHGNVITDSSINGDVTAHGNVITDSSINGNVTATGCITCHDINGSVTAHSLVQSDRIGGNIYLADGEALNILPSKDMLAYISEPIRSHLSEDGSAEKFLKWIEESTKDGFALTDDNIERLLDAYRELYRGMRKSK